MAYNVAATILAQLNQHKGSLKNLVYSSTFRRKKELYALVCETLKSQKVLDFLISRTNLTKKSCSDRDQWLLRVLIYEHVFGKGLDKKWSVKLGHNKNALKAEVARLKILHKVCNNEDLIKIECGDTQEQELPRYVRVNTLKSRVDEVIEELTRNGFTYKEFEESADHEKFLKSVKQLGSAEFTKDNLIPQLLIFASNTDFHSNTLYKEGKIILQDKASCLPVYVLSELGLSPGQQVLDCCAAPGNKTSYVAALLENTGTVFAFDKDRKRLNTMKRLLDTAGVTCVQFGCEDFLKVNANDLKYHDVELAIVDPSCSGSGIVSRFNNLTDSSDASSASRLSNLAAFQCSVLLHALSFPNVKTVVYSTCSVHEEENEQVVEAVMKKAADTFDLANILPDYSSRGMDSYRWGKNCLRLSPETDLTNGFFVACFQRKTTQPTESGGLSLSADVDMPTANTFGSHSNELSQQLSGTKRKIERQRTTETNTRKKKTKRKKMKLPVT